MALPWPEIRAHEERLGQRLLDALGAMPDACILGPREMRDRLPIVSFTLNDVHPHDLSQVLDQHNVCVRAGHHCAKPLMRLIGANATARASFYLYNTTDEADALADALESASDIF